MSALCATLAQAPDLRIECFKQFDLLDDTRLNKCQHLLFGDRHSIQEQILHYTPLVQETNVIARSLIDDCIQLVAS